MKRKIFLLLAAILGMGACLRLPSLTFPLWLGDEATYVGYAQNLLSGRFNYINDCHYITPGITYVYSFLLFLFGANNMLAVHSATILVYGASCYFIYRLGSHLADEQAGLLAALLFSIYSVCFNPMWCFSSLPEPFYIFFNTLGIFVLLKFTKKSAFFSGMVLAISVLFKQSELLIIFTALIFLTFSFPHLLISFMAGTATVFFGAFLIFVWQGAWGDFWYQNFEILLKSLSKRWAPSLNQGMKASTSQVFWRFLKSHIVIWGGAIITVAFIFTQKRPNLQGTPRGNNSSDWRNNRLTFSKEKYQCLLLIIIWPLLYGVSFFLLRRINTYYLLVLLPPLTVLAGIGFSLLWQSFPGRGRQIATLLVIAAIVLSYQSEAFPVMRQTLHYAVKHHQFPFFNRLPTRNYDPTLVNEVINHTDKSERVLLWGWYCWVNILADRRFGIGLLETEVLSKTEEDPELYQYLYRKVERQLKEDQPEVIIDIPGTDNPKRLTEYPGLMNWVAEHYKAQPFMKGTLYRRFAETHSYALF